MKLARLHVVVDGVEVFGHHADAARVADKDDFVAELIRTYVDVECGTIVVDDKFRCGNYSLFCHNFGY